MNPIGLAGHAFRGYQPEQLFAFIRRVGATGLDYWPWNRGEWSVADFRARADEAGVQVYSVNVPGAVARVADPSAAPDWTRHIVAAMDEAVLLGARLVQVYSGVPQAQSLDQSAAALVESVRPLVDEARKRDVILVLENNLDQRDEDHRRLNPSRRPEAIRRAIDALPPEHFRITYDPCNFVTVGVEEYPLGYDLLADAIVNVHVKDCRRFLPELHASERAAAKLLVDSGEGPFLPTPLGAGAVAWREIGERLVRDGYQSWITLDPFIADDLLEAWCLDAATRLPELLAVGARVS